MHADKGEPNGLKGENINIKKKQKQSNKNNTSFLWSAMRFTEKFCSTMVMNTDGVHTDPAEKAWTLTDAIFLAHI